jgi:hypothetical protein
MTDYAGEPPAAAMVVPQFLIAQRITVMVNRYEIRAANPDGTEGQLLAFAEQKRMKLKEEVNFYADEAKTRRVFSFKARQTFDVRASTTSSTRAATRWAGSRRSSGRACCARPGSCRRPGSTPSAGSAVPFIAILRRVWDFIPWLGDIWMPFVFHFDFVDTTTGATVMVSTRQKAIRDRYTVTVPDPRLDFRVPASMAVALDALQTR